MNIDSPKRIADRIRDPDTAAIEQHIMRDIYPHKTDVCVSTAVLRTQPTSG
jgi:hypothetical protein